MKKNLKKIWNFVYQLNHIVALASIAMILLALLFIYTNYDKTKNARIEEEKQRVQASAELAANGLNFLFTKYFDELSFLTKSGNIIDFNDTGKEELRRFYLNHKKTITAITRISDDGKILYTYPFSPLVIGKDVSKQAHNAYILREHKPIVSNIFLSLQGYETVAFAYPVFNNKKFNGCLSLLIPFKPLISSYFSGSKVWKNLHVQLFTKTGEKIYSNFTTQSDTISNLDKINEGFITIDNEYGKKLVFVKRINLPGNTWFISLSLPRSDLYRLEKELTWDTYIIIFLIILSFIILIIASIKSRREKLIALQEREALYRVITKATGYIIYEYNIDSNKIELFGNSRELIGVDLDEFTPFPIEEWWKYVYPEDINDRSLAINSSKELNRNFVCRYRMIDIDGNIITVEDRYVFEKNKKGEYLQKGVIRDVSDEEKNNQLNDKNRLFLANQLEEKNKELIAANKKLEEQLETAVKHKNELKAAKEELLKAKDFVDKFLLMMSDQLKSPTQAMVGLSGLIRDSVKDIGNREIVEILNLLLGSIDKNVNSVNLILSAANLISNSYKSNKVKFDLESLIYDAVLEFKRKAEVKGLYFKTDFQLENVKIVADKVALEVGVRQLLDNAIKFTSEGGIRISVYKNIDEKIVIKIIDTGDGMNEEFQKKIFSPFQQKINGYVREKGMGLGLWITKKYFDLSDISIRLFSKEGEGTEATILLN